MGVTNYQTVCLVLSDEAVQLLKEMVTTDSLGVSCSACGGEWKEPDIHCWLCPWWVTLQEGEQMVVRCLNQADPNRPCELLKREVQEALKSAKAPTPLPEGQDAASSSAEGFSCKNSGGNE